MERDDLLHWVTILDDVTYYQILGVDACAGYDDIKEAFYHFAEAFHPDAHGAEDAARQRAAHTVFKRGVEAYRVLTDPGLRSLYDNALGEGDVRPKSLSSMRPPPPSAREGTIADNAISMSARPFAHRAEELAKNGDYGQAKLYLNLALFHDPQSVALAAYRTWLEGKIAGKR